MSNLLPFQLTYYQLEGVDHPAEVAVEDFNGVELYQIVVPCTGVLIWQGILFYRVEANGECWVGLEEVVFIK